MSFEADVFITTTVAMAGFFLGYAIVRRSSLLRIYGIPESVVGGAIFAIAIALVYAVTDLKITFDPARRDILLIYLFAALGLKSNPRELFASGRPLLLLVGLAAVFIVVQNVTGIAIARLFGFEPQVGIVAGSMALIGRSGTTIAWAPIFEARFAVEYVSRLGLSVNMAGLIAACVVGGPIARFLIDRHRVTTPGRSFDRDIAFGQDGDADGPRIDHHAVLLALLRIHIAILVGHLISEGLQAAGITMPLYITSLIAGIALGNVKPRLAPGHDWASSDQSLTLIAYVSLGLFYTMTWMNLQLWTAGGYVLFLVVVIVIQSLIVVVYACAVVFPLMGRDYDAVVTAAGFSAMALGSTATTMAVMSAVTQAYGRAHRAFVIVPLTCGVFLDILNSFAIGLFAALS